MRHILSLFLFLLVALPNRVLADAPPTCVNIDLEAAQSKLVQDVGISLQQFYGLIQQLPLQGQQRLRKRYLKRNLSIRNSLVDTLSNLPGEFTVCLLQPLAGQCSVVLLAEEKETLSISLERLLELYREVAKSFGATLPSRLRVSLKRYGKGVRDLIGGAEEVIEALPDQVLQCLDA